MKNTTVSPNLLYNIFLMFPYILFVLAPIYGATIFEEYSSILTLGSIFGLAIIFIKLWYISTIKYSFYDGQIIFNRGILSKKTDYLELYRVKDYNKYQSILMRIFRVMKITLNTSDNTHRVFVIDGIRKSNLAEELRLEVEKYRKERRVYEVD